MTFDSAGIIFIFKILLIIIISLHFIFSIVMVQQIRLMIKVVEAGISPVILITALVHLFFSLFVLMFILIFV